MGYILLWVQWPLFGGRRMIIVLSVFTVIFISWLLYISIAEASNPSRSDTPSNDPAKVTHEKLTHINTLLEIEQENPK